MLKVIVMDKGIVVIGTNQLIESLFHFIVRYFSGQFYLHGKQLGIKLVAHNVNIKTYETT